MKLIVSNAGPLIALAKINQFQLLREIFKKVIVPDAVWNEVVVQGAGKPGADEVRLAEQEGWLQRQSVRDAFAVELLRAHLGAGESEAIVLAREVQAIWVLLDDAAARDTAKNVELPVKGTVGILIAAYQAGLLTDLKASLDELRTKGFRLNDRIYNAVLASI